MDTDVGIPKLILHRRKHTVKLELGVECETYSEDEYNPEHYDK